MKQYSEPVKLIPHFARALWGGELMKKVWSENAPYTDTSESWEVSAHPAGESRVEGSDGVTVPLTQWIAEADPEAFYGAGHIRESFPFLVKIIAPEKDLSVQVHPDEETAALIGGCASKTEAWYIMDAPKDAKLIYGIEGGVNAFREAVKAGNILPVLRWIPVKIGDVVFIASGTVHALTAGVVVYEIQQTSNTTFRVYDWDRVDAQGNRRELHIREACLAVHDIPAAVTPGVSFTEPGAERRICVCHPDFTMEETAVSGNWSYNPVSCTSVTVLEGSGILHTKQGNFELSKGSTWLIPAVCGSCAFSGKMKLLIGSLMTKGEVSELLRAHGFSDEALGRVGGTHA